MTKKGIMAADLFCGGGGTSSGLAAACKAFGLDIDLLAINHWNVAIQSHWANHPWARHMCQNLDAVDPTKAIPGGRLDILVASPECIYHSSARGGRPIQDQLRTSAWHVLRWAERLHIESVLIENVPEFCFPKDTLVWTKGGLLPIQDLRVGMKVLTHQGRWRRITDVHSRIADTVIVKATGGRIEATGNHPFYARKAYAKCAGGKYGRHWKALCDPEWMPASELAPDRLNKSSYRRKYSGYSIGSPTFFPRMKAPLLDGMESEMFWRVIGFWLGDGWIRRRRGRADGIRVCANLGEERLVGSWLIDLKWMRFNAQRRKSVVVFEATNAVLASWIIQYFCEGAGEKTIPPWALSLPAAWKRAMVDGYTQADGHRHKKDGRIRAVTVSKKLAIGMKAVIDSLGVPASVNISKISRSGSIDGRPVRSKKTPYWITWKDSTEHIRILEDGISWAAVRSVSQGNRNASVYDISVEGDHSFIADGFVVHNCKWGPLNSKGKRIKALEGKTYKAFLEALRALGYTVEDRILNAADYGDATSRRRLFIMARKGDEPITWPEPTHAKDGKGGLKRWRAAREIIDWTNPGISIFNREEVGLRPLVESTLRRIEAGLQKFCGFPPGPFLVKLYGTGKAASMDQPLPTVTATGQHIALCNPFILGHRQFEEAVIDSVDRPLRTITTKSVEMKLAQAFLVPYFGEREGQAPRTHSIDEPLPTVTGHGAGALVDPKAFLVEVNHGGADGCRIRDVEIPLKTLTGKNGHALVTCQPFLVKYFGTAKTQSVDQPLGTLTTKARYALCIPIGDGKHGIVVDILLRMLDTKELAAGMSFPKEYRFSGGKGAQVKQIGNAVPCKLAEALCGSLLSHIPRRDRRLEEVGA